MAFKAVPQTPQERLERDAQVEEALNRMVAKAKALDFTNVKDRMFNIKHLPEGDYPARIKDIADAKSKKTGNPMWLITIELTGGGPGTKGASFPYYCNLDADNLWKIRNVWAACGVNIPKKRVNIDPGKVVGRPLGVTLEDDEYEGKLKSVIAACIPLSDIQPPDEDEDEDEDSDSSDTSADEDADDEDEDEAPPAKPAKADKPKKPKKPAASDDDDDELEELEIEDL